MPNVGPLELIIVLVVILLLFGSTKLPKLARSIGEASQEFKKGVADGAKDDAKAIESRQTESRPTESRPKPTDKVTMTQAELDALLSEREAQARKESASE
jgi:sec-independent protein translocase protein TatA